MYCARCNHDLWECVCPDIEERLQSLLNTPLTPAAIANLQARKMTKALNLETDQEH